jgi:uncharacterized membrane protein
MNKNNKSLFVTQYAMLLALEAIVCFTPLGSIPVGPLVATLMCLPVIAAALLFGTAAGAAMGAVAGLFSLIVWTFMPPNPLTAFVFTPFYSLGMFKGGALSLVICFVPRVLVGVSAGLIMKLFKKNNILSFGLGGIIGSLVNTFLVLGGIYVFFGIRYAEAINAAHSAMLGIIGVTILTNGIPEAVLGGLVGFYVCRPVRKFIIKS